MKKDLQIECSATETEIIFFFMALAREKNDTLDMYYMEESEVLEFVKNTFSVFRKNPTKKYFPINLRTSQKGRLRFFMTEFCNLYGSKTSNEIKKYALVLKHSFEIFKDDNILSLINTMQIKKGPIEKNRIKHDINQFKFKMARPTKAEQEKRRIAGLLAEGKGPDGELLSPLLLNPKGVCKYCSSTFEITHGSQKFCPERNGKKNFCSNKYSNAKKKKDHSKKKKKVINPHEVEEVLNDAKNKYSIEELEKEIEKYQKEIEDHPNYINPAVRDKFREPFQIPEPEPIVRTASDNKIAIAIAVISFLMSLYNFIW